GLAIYALSLNPVEHRRKQSAIWIIGGGAIAPTIILSVLLVYGLSLLPPLLAKPSEGTLQIEVEGRQWWWRVKYRQTEREPLELANEIRLPVGEPVEFILTSGDVVHSFWIPALGGKVDMLPGRTTRLTLEPTKIGTYRGVCAEYCGTSHALMNFSVVVLSKEDFEAWLNQQKSPAYQTNHELAIRGQEIFINSGCGACHSVRGTSADGIIGPDLTHVGSRNGLAADALPNDPESFRNWIAHTKTLKPDALMPEFQAYSEEELSALAKYLDNLE
ncbi:cytochrome c oxidase subunit II, partial [uncultured Rubinisphaera sp.]|uniref:cytochrome c oxidase subunit II n=1 Tax=uncultured Rubinisphaera sp. TaxID=1678686 RepID=UPI0030D723A5